MVLAGPVNLLIAESMRLRRRKWLRVALSVELAVALVFSWWLMPSVWTDSWQGP